MKWSGLLKAFSGFLVAIALLVGGAFLAAQYLITQFTTPPPKPMFANEKTASTAQPAAIATPPKSPQGKPTPRATASPKPSESSYQAIITLSEGLNVRSNPSTNADRVGGVDFDEEITVLEESSDKEWQRVRGKTSGIEGWIKSGYTERIN